MWVSVTLWLADLLWASYVFWLANVTWVSLNTWLRKRYLGLMLTMARIPYVVFIRNMASQYPSGLHKCFGSQLWPLQRSSPFTDAGRRGIMLGKLPRSCNEHPASIVGVSRSANVMLYFSIHAMSTVMAVIPHTTIVMSFMIASLVSHYLHWASYIVWLRNYIMGLILLMARNCLLGFIDKLASQTLPGSHVDYGSQICYGLHYSYDTQT